jgi:hypothetical protein
MEGIERPRFVRYKGETVREQPGCCQMLDMSPYSTVNARRSAEQVDRMTSALFGDENQENEA